MRDRVAYLTKLDPLSYQLELHIGVQPVTFNFGHSRTSMRESRSLGHHPISIPKQKWTSDMILQDEGHSKGTRKFLSIM